jgi:hypothetical protein
MIYRIIVLLAILCTVLRATARAQDFDFQDDIVALHYSQSIFNGPGVLPGAHMWTPYYEPGTYLNNGVTLTLSGFDEVPIPNYGVFGPPPNQNTPAFVLSQALTAQETATFELDNIPATPLGDTYDLVLYATNFAANAGTAFSLFIGSGSADKGISSTHNAFDPGQTSGPNDIFSEGRNYAVFDNVIPVMGTIVGTATPLFTEADLNAVQLVTVPVPEPATLTLAALLVSLILLRWLAGYSPAQSCWPPWRFSFASKRQLT